MFVMSALPSKADMCGATRNVRYGSLAVIEEDRLAAVSPKSDQCFGSDLVAHVDATPSRPVSGAHAPHLITVVVVVGIVVGVAAVEAEERP
jgi:hypothetical protein